MSLISENIMEEFSAWAEKSEDKSIFPMISKEEDSYYIDRETEETYMMEYSFETMAELKNLINAYSGLADDPQMLRKLVVEIMQNRFKSQLEMQESLKSNKTQDDNKNLPEFVYVF